MARRKLWKRWLYIAAVFASILTVGGAKPDQPPPPSSPPKMSHKQVYLAWLLSGLIVSALIVFFEIDTLLGSIQGGGLRSYSTSAFTGPSFPPWDVSDLSAALQLWLTGEHHDLARTLITAHAAADGVFIVAYSSLLWLWVGSKATGHRFVNPKFGKGLVALLAIFDGAETVATLWLPGTPLALLQWLTLAKWVMVVAVAVWLLLSWLQKRRADAVTAVVDSHSGAGPQLLGSATAPLVVVTAVFLLLIAFPGEGALGQLPDVLRYQFAEATEGVRALSILALGVFIATVAAAGFIATGPVTPVNAKTWPPLFIVLGVTGALFIVAWALNGSPAWGPLAPLIVVAAIAVIGFLSTKRVVEVGRGSDIAGDEVDKANRIGLIAGVVAVGGGLGALRAAVGPLLVESVDYSGLEWWIAILAVILLVLSALWLASTEQVEISRLVVVGVGFTVVTGGVIFQPGLLWAGALGLTGAIVGGFLTWLSVTTLAPHRLTGVLGGRSGMRSPLALVFVVVVVAAGLLAVSPPWARWVGTTGALVTGLGFIAILAGTLVWLSRKYRPWWVTESAGLGPRPPWGIIFIVAWVVASPLTGVGYHDARVDDTSTPHYQYPGLGDYPSPAGSNQTTALATWLDAQTGCAVARDGHSVYPMLLVAAPGGGIRAAYWTAQVLDRLTPETNACAERRLFLLSGVSGGSVGIASWLASREAGVESRETVAQIAGDEALAAGAVGLFRDLFQPLLGVTDRWGDRAELLEKGWVSTAQVEAKCVFGESAEPGDCSTEVGDLLAWADITDHEWTPVVIFNGSSVAESCRVVLSNVRDLPASPGLDCRRADAAAGPLIVSTDPRSRLLTRSTEVSGRQCPDANAELPLITSALLSARVPVASPSGALHGCNTRASSPGEDEENVHAVKSQTFVVDGGYYENSGLLSLLGIWDDLAPSLAAYNADAAASNAPYVEPWIVIVSNSYSSLVLVPPPSRPPELLLPITTFLAARDAYGQATFEQLAVDEVNAFASNPCGNRTPCFTAKSKVLSIAPTQRPTVAAPLGWVLSKVTRADLDDNLRELEGEGKFADLVDAIGVPNR